MEGYEPRMPVHMATVGILVGVATLIWALTKVLSAVEALVEAARAMTSDIVRDPETGQFKARESGSQLDRHRIPDPTWGNCEHQTILTDVEQDVGGQSTVTAMQVFDVVSDRLDSNEIAELIAMDVEVSLRYISDQGSAADPNGVEATAEIGLNQPLNEAITKDDMETVLGEGVGEGNKNNYGGWNPPNTVGRLEIDRPGSLYSAVLAVHGSWEDGTVGSGGGGPAIDREKEFRSFRDAFFTGPVVDASDEIYVRSFIQKGDGADGEYSLLTKATMYWAPAVVPGGRPEFSLPNL